MNLTQFLNGISFRFLDPSGDPRRFTRAASFARRAGLSFEVLNTRLPRDRRGARRNLRRLSSIPKMSTYALGAIIDKAVSAMPPGTAFLNVGAWHGFTFLSGLVNNKDRRCLCVDNFSQFGGPKEDFLRRFNAYKGDRHEFFEDDYKAYFTKTHREPLGFYIYDGEHSYENQLAGLEVAEPFFADGCVILVDDTNTEDPRRATLDFMAKRPGRYQLLFDRTTHSNCHPTYWNGVMLIGRV